MVYPCNDESWLEVRIFVSRLVTATSRIRESNGNVGEKDRFADTVLLCNGEKKDAYLPSLIASTDVPLTLPRGTLESISAERVLSLSLFLSHSVSGV